ncbi:MAG: class I SAM-dependent methyltransferase [Bacillota bacterium]|nr:class I SAM-dependent methyltransferase [Bacillota bacterium]
MNNNTTTSTETNDIMNNGENVKKGYYFGWSPIAMNMHWIAGIIILFASFMAFHLLPNFPPVTVLLAMISTMLFVGCCFIRTTVKEEFITLPYVDLFSQNSFGPVLDVGCGSGRTTIALSKVIGERPIVALDRFDASYIQDGGKTLFEKNMEKAGISNRVQIVNGNAENMKFEDGMFDAAVSTNVLDHSQQKLEILNEIYRVLKPEGRLLLNVMVPNLFTFAIAGPLCLVFIKKSAWRDLLGKSGFKLLDEGVVNNCTYFLVEKTS